MAEKNQFNNLDDDDMFVTLDLDDGSSVECQILTIFEAEGRDYIALLPLDENGDEIELKDDEDEDTGFGGRMNFGDDDLSLYDENTVGNDVSSDEAADNGYEIQDEDDVFGLLDDYTTDGSVDDTEN